MTRPSSVPGIRLALLSLAVVLTAACSTDVDDGDGLEISRVLVAEPVLGERAAMYFFVHNSGDDDDVLLDVATPAAGRAELHRTVRDVVATVVRYAELEAALEATTWEREGH